MAAILARVSAPLSDLAYAGMFYHLLLSGLAHLRAAVLKNRHAAEQLNVGLYGHAKHSLTVAREDLAKFMFDQIANHDFVRRAPGISTRQ